MSFMDSVMLFFKADIRILSRIALIAPYMGEGGRCKRAFG